MIFFTMLTIALSCMMMITFRAALYPVTEVAGGAVAKAGDSEVVQYKQQVNEPQDGGDLHLVESTDAGEVAKQPSTDDAEILEADNAVQIY